MKISKIELEELTCPSCINKIERTLSKKEGVQEVRVLFNSSQVKVTHQEDLISADQLVNLIEKLGYRVSGAVHSS
ncbi:MAG: heavy-metal-associated domain-containing protein [Chitinophagaceae bacterium]|jgi:copper chaperone CopZ|nr:MAG: heavy-metal-associated domain-containing protein [Chitinophagaceae bacterium]